MQEHKQVRIKVNAYADEKIAPVIEAMSQLPDVVTEFSCEDNRTDTSDGIPRAYIMFHTKDRYKNWKALGNVCDTLAKAIVEYSHAELFLRWREGKPVGIFEFNTQDAHWLTLAINNFLENRQ